MEAVLNGAKGPINLSSSVLTIGRVPGSDILMDDPQSSGRHAEIHPEGQGYSIIDLGSRNGTYVNEQKLSPNIPRLLYSGDKIRIGTTSFTYQVSGIAPIAPTVYVGQPPLGTEEAFPKTVAVPQPHYENKQRGKPLPQQPMQSYTVPVAPFNAAIPRKKPKKSRRGLWVALALIVLVVLLAGAAFAAVAYANRSTPQKTLSAFCADLKNNDYHDAYGQMSNKFQSTTSEDAFTRLFKNTFARGGGLKDCQFGGETDNGSTGSAVLTFTVNFTLVPPQPRNSTLVTDSGVWKIDSIARQ